jgi:hypothetical protein
VNEIDIYKRLLENHWIEVEFWDERKCGCGQRFEGPDGPDAIQHHFLNELFGLWCVHDERGQIWDDQWLMVYQEVLRHQEDTPEWCYAKGRMDVIEEEQAKVMNELWDRYLA